MAIRVPSAPTFLQREATEIAPEDNEQIPPFIQRTPPELPSRDLGDLHVENRALSDGLDLIRENERILQAADAMANREAERKARFIGPPAPPGPAAQIQAKEEGERPGTGLEQFLPVQLGAGLIDMVNDIGESSRDLTNFFAKSVGGIANAKIVFGGPEGPVSFAAGEEARDIPSLLEKLTPEVTEARTVLGRTVRAVSKFVGAFIGVGKFKPIISLAKLGRTGELSAMALRGAAADFTVFDPHEERLANMMQRVPALRNPIAEFLAAKPDDEEATGRFKNAIEGLGIGAMADGLFQAVRLIRSARRARAAATGIPEDVAVKELLETTQRQRDNLEAFLGDPKAPLFKIEPIVMGRPQDVAEALTQAAAVPGRVGQANEIFINWSRIDSHDDVKTVIQAMVDSFAPTIEKARRGVRTWRQTKLSAEQKDAWDLLAQRKKGQPFGADETIAVRELWMRSGANVLDIAQAVKADPSDINKIALRKGVAVHNAIQEQAVAARTETARALNAWKITIGDDVAFSGRMAELKSIIESDTDIAHIAERIVLLADAGLVKEADAFIYGSGLAKGSDIIRQLFYMSMLSSPHTHMRNLIGNTAVIPIQMLERKFANLFGRAFGVENIPRGETLAMFWGGIKGLKDAFRFSNKGRQVFVKALELRRAGDKDAAKLLIQENATEFGTFYRSLVTGQSGIGVGKVELPRLGAFDPEKLGLGKDDPFGRVMFFVDTMTTMPMRALAAADEVYKSTTGGMELQARAWRKASNEVSSGQITEAQFADRLATLVNNPDEEMQLAKRMFAEMSTFTNEPLDTALWRTAKNWQRIPVLGRLTLPFRRTPYNLATFTFQRTPLAPFVKQWRVDILAGGASADLAWSKFLLGNAVLLSMGDLAMQGLITGQGPSNRIEREGLRRGGWEPWSVKTFRTDDKGNVLTDDAGNALFRYFSYRSLEPISTPIGLAANVIEILRYAEWDDDDSKWDELILASSLAIAAQVTSQNYMSGISDFFDTMSDPQRYGEKWWMRIGTLVVPRGVQRFARAGFPGLIEADPTLRMATSIMESIRRDTPGLSDDLPAAPDAWGRDINRSSGIGSVYDLISPIYSRDPSPEPIDRELNRLELWVGVPPKNMSFRGVTIDLAKKPRIWSRYVRLQGNQMTEDADGIPVGITGQGLMDELTSLVTGNHPLSIAYEELTDGPDGGKAQEILLIIREYREAAKEVLLGEFPDLEADVERKLEDKAVTFKFEEQLRP